MTKSGVLFGFHSLPLKNQCHPKLPPHPYNCKYINMSG